MNVLDLKEELRVWIIVIGVSGTPVICFFWPIIKVAITK